MNSYQFEFVPVSRNYPLSHQYGTTVVETQTSLPRNVPSGEIEAPRNGCIRRPPPWGYSQPYPLEALKKTFRLRIILIFTQIKTEVNYYDNNNEWVSDYSWVFLIYFSSRSKFGVSAYSQDRLIVE